MMKDYKDFPEQFIGYSDIACLVLAGFQKDEGFVTMPLWFGNDGGYFAYVVDSSAIIGSHYVKVAEFNSWLKIYDDDGGMKEFKGSRINVFRAGEMGCIIQVLN